MVHGVAPSIEFSRKDQGGGHEGKQGKANRYECPFDSFAAVFLLMVCADGLHGVLSFDVPAFVDRMHILHCLPTICVLGKTLTCDNVQTASETRGHAYTAPPAMRPLRMQSP